MNNRFVIFCTARSGSYLLVDYLNQFKEVTCYGEIFKKDVIELPAYLKNKIQYNTVKQRNAVPLKYMNEVYWNTMSKLVGFKIFPNHNQKVLKCLTESKKISKVILRRNEIEVHLSLHMARKTRIWINKGNKKINNNSKIEFNPDVFIEHFKNLSNYYSELKKNLKDNNLSYFEITYSEVVQKEKIYELIKFLTNNNFDKSIHLKTNLVKQIQKKYYDIVSNYDEMVEFLESNYPKEYKSSKLFQEIKSSNK